MSQGSRRRR